ncbi:hypothetical protein Trydic_g1565 [Trypoxylus dichotomus]
MFRFSKLSKLFPLIRHYSKSHKRTTYHPDIPFSGIAGGFKFYGKRPEGFAYGHHSLDVQYNFSISKPDQIVCNPNGA